MPDEGRAPDCATTSDVRALQRRLAALERVADTIVALADGVPND